MFKSTPGVNVVRSGRSGRFSRLACQLSVRKLARLEKSFLTWLHTLTFVDPEPDEKEAARRFNSLATGVFRRRGMRCVWSLQRGEKTGRLHFHLVSAVRWEASEMWAVLGKYGFGRYDVQPAKPVEFADYVARYIGRKSWFRLKSGVRSWGTVGFERTCTRDVRAVTIELTRVTDTPQWLVRQVLSLSLSDVKLASRVSFLQARYHQEWPEPKMNEITQTQLSEIATESQSGKYAIIVGEYRGYHFRVYKGLDALSKEETSRGVVDHTVLVGTDSLTVTEYLSGSGKESDIKAPAQSGERVVVRVGKWARTARGISIQGYVKALATLPLVPSKGGARG